MKLEESVLGNIDTRRPTTAAARSWKTVCLGAELEEERGEEIYSSK